MDDDQLALDFGAQVQGPRAAADDELAKGPPEAKRSISYMLNAVLQFGHVSSGADLLDRVAMLCLTTGYRPFNALLMLLQRPAASFVLPAHQWQERFGHVIRPGEQPIVLLQPGGPLMFLLDVSQVEPGAGALPLPAYLADPYAMADVPVAEHALGWITENAKYDGVRVTPAPLGQGHAGCVAPAYSVATQRITVRRKPEPVVEAVPVRFDVELNRGHSATEQLATLAHELGHVYCGHLGPHADKRWKGRQGIDHDIEELEAESVARVVFKTLAPGAELPEHLAQYFAQQPDLAGASLEAVLAAAGRVLDISVGWAPRWKKSTTKPAAQ